MAAEPRPTEPEFTELKRQRDESLQSELSRLFEEKGWDPAKATVHVYTNGPADCYCACGTGGPCQHEWNGPWREFEDGCGGETTCSRCGYGSMSHDMWLF